MQCIKAKKHTVATLYSDKTPQWRYRRQSTKLHWVTLAMS